MKRNFISKKIANSRIGLDKEEKFLTLSCHIDYEIIKYTVFKEKLEDFINFVSYLQKEIEQHKRIAKETIL
jgi:hypothetical protein